MNLFGRCIGFELVWVDWDSALLGWYFLDLFEGDTGSGSLWVVRHALCSFGSCWIEVGRSEVSCSLE